MKKIFILIICIMILTISSLAVQLPSFEIIDGNTVIQTIKINSLAAQEKAFMQSWFTSPNNMLLFDAYGDYMFVIVSENADVTFRRAFTEGMTEVYTNVSTDYLQMMKFTKNGEFYESTIYQGSLLNKFFGAPLEFSGFVMGNYLQTNNYTLPTLTTDYIATYTGNLMLVTDETEQPQESLFDKLKGILVPSDDYFNNWFNDIMTAFNAKFGGIKDLFNSIGTLFDNLKNTTGESTLIIKTNDNQFYNGYKGIEVDALTHIKPLMNFIRGLFNACLFLFTVIICYRKLIVTIRG